MAGQSDRAIEELREATTKGNESKEGGPEEAGSKEQDPACICQEGREHTSLTRQP